MIQKNSDKLLNLLKITANHIVFYPIVLILFYGFGEKHDCNTVFYTFLILIPILQYLIRLYAKNGKAIWLYHILSLCLPVAVSFLIIKDGYAVFIICITSVLYTFFSLYTKFKKRQNDVVLIPIFIIYGLSVISMLILHNQDTTKYDTYLFITIAVFSAIMIPTIYLENYIKFLKTNASSAGYIPKNHIFSAGFLNVIITNVFAFAGLILLSLFRDFSKLVDFIKNIFLEILSFIVKHLKQPEYVNEEVTKNVTNDVYNGYSTNEGNTVFKVILFIVTAVLLFFAIIVIIRLLIKGVGTLINSLKNTLLYRRYEKSKEDESIGIYDTYEKLETVNTYEHVKKRITREKTPALQIRSLFKEKVLSLNKQNRSINELSKKTSGDFSDIISDEAINLYDKARYSNEEINSFDVKNMKTYVKGKIND